MLTLKKISVTLQPTPLGKESMTICFNPNDRAKSTDTLQVEFVRRASNGEIIEVKEWMATQTEEQIHCLRTRIRQGNGENFSCFCCGQNVLLRKHERGGHYFAHREKSAADKAECIYQQSQIISPRDRDRIRYQGQREGLRHLKTKELIADILRSDPGFSEPEIEKSWTTFTNGWRKPDVASKWNAQPIVFEVQVSNTYPQVVADRTDFYRNEGALLIWIYDRVTESEWRTLHADNFCSNGRHLFIVDEECAAISKAEGLAYFKIYTQRPEVEPFKCITDGKWKLKIVQKEYFELVPFSSLSLNADSQTATYFDIKKEQFIINHKVLCAEVQAGYLGDAYDLLERSIQEFLVDKRPIDRKKLEGWAALICGIESKKLERPIGTKYTNVVEVLNLVHDHHPSFFPHLVQVLDRLKIDPHSQRSGKWRNRVSDFYEGKYKGGPIPQSHEKSKELLGYIYF